MSRQTQALRWTLPAVICALLFCPVARCADYSLPISAFAEAGGSGSIQQYQLTYAVGQPSPIGNSSDLKYTLLNGLAALISDVVPPEIAHLPAEPVPRGMLVEITAEVTDAESGVDTVALVFRAGGSRTFTTATMAPGSGDSYRGTIPAAFVTERGLVYYIEARDRIGNRARFPRGAPDSLINLPVSLAALVSEFEVPAGKYRMISLPGVPSNGVADSVLADDFGTYDKKSWRLGRWNPSRADCGERCYDEYPAIDSLAPGRAFWIISSAARAFDFSGTTSDISVPFASRLDKGWNQIGTPFDFDTDWLSARIRFDDETYAIGQAHVVGDDTILVADDLIGYEPSGGTYVHAQSQLHPWTGYWIYNGSTQPVDLILDPGLGSPPLDGAARRAGAPGPPVLDAGAAAYEFLVGVTLTSDGSSRQAAVAGLSPSASDAWDALDLREPPPVGDYARIAFRHTDWGRFSGAYASDIRHTGEDGAYWEFSVETSERCQPALGIEPARVPQGWELFLYDLDEGVRFDREALPRTFDVDGGRRFALIAGTEEYISAEETAAGIDLKTRLVSVTPNPFSQSIKITFFLPERQAVRLEVFSVEGRLVGTIGETDVERGIHSTTWDGRSPQGQPTAPGVYFIRLETSRTELTRKVLKLR